MGNKNLARAIEFEHKAFCEELKSHHFKILLSLTIIIITILLIIYYPTIAKSERIKFLIGSIWPSGVIVVLVPLWIGVVRDIRDNIGYKVYELIEEEIKQTFPDEQANALLGFLLDKRSQLTNPNKFVRRKALAEVIEKIEQQG